VFKPDVLVTTPTSHTLQQLSFSSDERPLLRPAPLHSLLLLLHLLSSPLCSALYNAAARKLVQLAPHIQLRVFSDRDINSRKVTYRKAA
jgi:hypothetical protein